MFKKVKSALCSIYILGNFISLQAQNETTIREINRVAYPLDTNAYLTKEFLPESTFTDKAILGLGESTHGTHEFFTTKDYIIRNQVLNNKTRVIAIEADFCRVLRLNRYLNDNSKPPALLLPLFNNLGIYPIYHTKELYNLLAWIKQYNLTKKSDEEKIKFLGLDMQTPYLIVQALLDSFPQLRVTDPDTHDKLLALKEHYISPNGGSLSKKELSFYKELADKITAVAKQVPNSNTLYISRFAELMKQSLSLEEGFLGGGYAAKRDEYMARNAIWIKENFTTGTEKMIIWAHNDHIAHAKIGGNYRMGYYLKEHYKENYYALSLVFDEGYTRAYDKTAKEFKSFYYPSSTYKGAIESVLKNISHPSFFINLTSGNNELTDFFAKNKYQKSVGQAYHSELNKTFLKLPVIECFDGLIFIKKTTAAESMN